DFGKDAAVFLVPVGPVRRGARRAGKREEGAVDPRGQAVPVGARAVLAVVVGAERQRGVRTEIVFGDPVEQLAPVLVGVDEAVAVLVGADKAAAQAAGLIELAADIQLGAVVIPTAGAGADRQTR